MLKRYLPYLIYLLIVVAIMAPLFRPGFVFLLDMVFPPQFEFKDYTEGGISAQLPLQVIVKFFDLFLPMDVVQKLILSLLLLLPGIFMYLLLSTEYEVPRDEEKSTEEIVPRDEGVLVTHYSVLGTKIWAFLAGLIYMLNPWTYERFLSGHWYVYLGYAFFPLFILFSIKFLRSLITRSSVLSTYIAWAITAACYPIINQHWAYMAAWIFLLLCVVIFTINKQWPSFKSVAKFVCATALVLVVVNSYWIFVMDKSQRTFNKISGDDLTAFATVPDESLGVYYNVLSLYGFWNHDYTLPKDLFKYWWLISGCIILLAAIGAVITRKSKNPVVIISLIIFIPALVLAVGMSSWTSRGITGFFFEYLPGFKGLRETLKIAGFLAFCYAILVPIAGKRIVEYLGSRTAYLTLVTFFMLLPVISVYSAFGGFVGQVKPAYYPQSWYAANHYFEEQQNVEKVLFLPWYGYLRMPFANNKLIANPSTRYFDVEIVAGKNIENFHLPDYEEREIDSIIQNSVVEQFLTPEDVEYFKSENISHMILVDEFNRAEYEYLESSEFLEKVLEYDDLVMYKIK